jgi:hypothetical protein
MEAVQWQSKTVCSPQFHFPVIFFNRFNSDSTKKAHELLVFCAAIFAPSPALLPALQESISIRAESVPLAKHAMDWV